MTELSPAAKSVHDAFWQGHKYPGSLSNVDLAAALRAVVEELHYKEQLGWTGYGYYSHFQNQIRAIADELEAND